MSGFERFQGRMSEIVLGTADNVDRFFGSDRHYTYEENRSRLKFLLDTDFIEDHGTEFTPRLRLHLVLPRFQNRLRFVFNEEEDDGLSHMREDIDEEANLALRWIGRQTKRIDLSFDIGLRYRDEALAGFGRANSQVKYPAGEQWAGRSTGQVYWYSDTGWRLDLRQYFERRISGKLFFRSRTRAQWYEEEHGVYPEQTLSVYHSLGPRHAVAYEAIADIIPAGDSVFDPEKIPEPDDDYARLQLRARYRVNVRWPWFFLEVWPIALFPEERDYDFVWEVRFRIETVFGYSPAGRTSLGEE